MQYETLCAYEDYRASLDFYPPLESNSYYDLTTGLLNVYTTDDKKFRLYSDEGTIYVGEHDFQIGENDYESFTVIANTKVVLDHGLLVLDAPFVIHGEFHMRTGSTVWLRNGARGIWYADSHCTIEDGINLLVEDGCSLEVYGEVDIHVHVIDQLLQNPNITVDTAAFIKAFGIEGEDVENRVYSLTDYDAELRTQRISQYTQGEHNTEYGRLGYVWRGGDPVMDSTQIELGVLYGEAILGDFRLSILGYQDSLVQDLLVLTHCFVEPGSTLYISALYHEKRFIRPELYLGYIRGNVSPGYGGTCLVEGTIVVDGIDSKITIDRYAKLTIAEGGSVVIQNQANLVCNLNPDEVGLEVNGTLTIDSIEQIQTFQKDNIVFGPQGKLVILNHYEGDHVRLWTTPSGIHNTDLYRLFAGRLDHVEYHLQPNTGIGIDEYYEFYARDLIAWYDDMRIERAIHEGRIVWHPGAFIELDRAIIPWVSEESTLLQASRIFKSYGSYDGDKLQEVVNRLRYAGASDITFRFIHGDTYHDVRLVLDASTMYSIVNNPMTNNYILNVQTNDGELYLRNKVPNTEDATIIQYTSRVIPVVVGDNQFTVDPQ